MLPVMPKMKLRKLYAPVGGCSISLWMTYATTGAGLIPTVDVFRPRLKVRAFF